MVTLFATQFGERVISKVFMPMFPIEGIKKIINLFCARECNRRSWMFCCPIGMCGEQENDISSNALGEKRCRLCIKRGNEMSFGKVVGSITNSKCNLDIVGTERIPTKRCVKTVPLSFKKAYPRI